jgi:HlyD family secretion protein
MKKTLLLILAAACIVGAITWLKFRKEPENPNIIRGNGRIEATEIDLATKISGRLEEMLVSEGDFVTAGQVLAKIHSASLEAELAENRARHAEAINEVASAEAQVTSRKSDKLAAEAVVRQRTLQSSRR